MAEPFREVIGNTNLEAAWIMIGFQ